MEIKSTLNKISKIQVINLGIFFINLSTNGFIK